ncbi:hypothetical protein CCACVL1_05745 [Corchorus capsularis]|uniref:F-box domain-containing protein n=1 Tax=Corchorus capsularis TaxID=210143 RepID=A0A1R3JJ41_COCAP|nr:hypothetical protein CCACVL1_05745 [Corchorus capsularis]
MEEQSVAKKKNNNKKLNSGKKKKINNVNFDDLPTELKVDILCRLSGKELVRLTLVSHPWQDFITVSCFSTMAALPLSYSGSIYVHKDSSRSSLYGSETLFNMLRHQSLNVDKSFRYVNLGTMEPHNCSDITLAQLMASCNGLVLICRGDRHYPRWDKDGLLEMHKVLYSYYVINPKTDQYVQVPKPSPSVCCYAALAYHPAESNFFKIVRFQGVQRLNVFNSETGDWVTSPFELENDITKANWVEQSAYLQGAIYRLSMSGHLLRFTVDKVVSKKDLARAIEIPGAIDKSEIPKLHVGLSNERIHLAMYDIQRTILKIWVLEEDYQWSLKCSFCCPQISNFYKTYVQSIGFHPYDEGVIFVSYFQRNYLLELKCLRYHEQNPIIENSRSFNYYRRYGSDFRTGPIYHLLQCEVPFACRKLQIKPLIKAIK